MNLRAWTATWCEIGSLIADHIGEGLTSLAGAIDPPVTVSWTTESPDETDDEQTYTIQLTPGSVRVGWCSTCLVSHAWLAMYADPDRPPVAIWGDHNDQEDASE